MTSRPLRIVVSLMHAGYLRHYGDPIRLLAERGHTVHVVMQRVEKDKGDAVLVDKLLADCPTVTASVAPGRAWGDGWRRLAWLVRSMTDLARYLDPRYADAPALRERMANKIILRVRWSRMDRVSKRICTYYVKKLRAGSDARMARRQVRRLTRIEEAIPPSREVVRFLRDVRADAVVASPIVEIGSPQVEFIKAAKHLHIPSAVAVASWDNLTNKGLIRVIPDRVVVWNDLQRRELEEMHGVSPDRVIITGAQKFDKWFARTPSTTREQFMANAGLDPAQPYVAYLCSSYFIARDEVTFVRRWLEALRSDERLRRVGVLVRPHPQNTAQWQDVDLSADGNVAIWPRGGEQPDADAASAAFFDTLFHADGVVGVNTSAMIEAAIVGNSVYTVLDPAFAATQEGTLHFHYLRESEGGFLHTANDLAEHVEQLAAGLEKGDAARAQTLAFVERFCRPHGLDVAAAPLVADAFEQLAAVPQPTHAALRPSALVLRLLLVPIALATRFGAQGSRWLSRRRGSQGEALPTAE